MGELDNQTFDIVLTTVDGDVVFEGEKTTYNNGFMGFWLPRDTQYIISIDYGDKSGVFTLETYDDSYTCITSFQLY